MLVKFDDNSHSYYLAPQKIKVGDKVESGSKKEIKIGNCMPLQDIPVGINIHNVEIQPGGGGKLARSAGTSVTISGVDGNYSLIKLVTTVVIALTIQVAASTFIGAALPMMAKAFRLDPAVVASPAITTIVDVLGLLIYFGIASAILGI